MSADARTRSPLLDCIRALAIILVLVYHVATRFPKEQLDELGRFVGHYGLLGVDIFFPLSGFLITGFLLSRAGGSFVKVFFLRRLFRIVPIYLVAVTAYLAAALATGFDGAIIDRIWINYTFLTGWFIFFDGVDTVPYTITWSLSVEEFAYIVFGLSAWFSRARFPLVIAFLVIAPVFLRYHLFAELYANIYFFPLARIDSIALGAVTAWLIHRRAPAIVILVALWGVVQAIRSTDTLLATTLFSSAFSLYTCIAIAVIHRYMLAYRNLVIDFFASVGFHSYFMYLFHFFFIHAVLMAPPLFTDLVAQFWYVCAASFILTYAAGVVSMRLFEGPIMRYGRRLEGEVAARREAAAR